MSTGRIVDQSYRPYDGPRLGAVGAIRSLVRHTAQRVLGLKRPARAKLLPIASAVIAYLPALVFVGITALLPASELRDLVLPSYGEYYGFITSALVVFTSLVAPEALCPDRRTGLLGLYLAAPLTRESYLAAKVAAVASLLSIATLGPPVLLLVANVFQGVGPEGIGDIVVLAVRVVAAGVMLSLLYTAVSLGVSSLTDRRALASAAVLLVLLVSGVVTSLAVNVLDGPTWLLSLDLFGGPFELVLRIHGERGDGDDLSSVATAALAAGVAAWTAAGLGVAWWRYRTLVVVR